jgi:hypothetical protein
VRAPMRSASTSTPHPAARVREPIRRGPCKPVMR